ncbi:tail fiber protein [Flavobacterium branchiicola]|uniref:Tail fiber protein n=1 Tax=Flavobacterium branchiicola TaxID=1114875 RepID=A0ABV9PK72_9FLAO|nr:tail fiber protein [Flavobacterium branchiicola]MBS7256143.1 hypothetical protein [Flavobacterium branchiicola]
MKKRTLVLFLILTLKVSAQINSPNGNNIFSYNGLADVTFKYPERGSGGRAFVHAPYNVLSINFEEDFKGGTRIGTTVLFKDYGNSFIAGGNFGVGTVNPLAKFQVDGGNILVRNFANVDNESAIMIAHSINVTNYELAGTSIRTITQNAGENTYGLQFFTHESYLTGQKEKMRILGNGNVGIGTTKPDSKLTVAGNIHAQEVKVTVNAGADFVFENDYALPSLEVVDKFIKENKHLPEIASAEKMKRDGINLAEMNIKLLQKIEEMTLYMIDMKKENEKQNKEIENLKKSIKSSK